MVLAFVFSLFQRFIALPLESRMLTHIASFLARPVWPPSISELGRPVELVCLAAAVLNGEMLGHLFEIYRRAAFARDFAASATRQSDAPAQRTR